MQYVTLKKVLWTLYEVYANVAMYQVYAEFK